MSNIFELSITEVTFASFFSARARPSDAVGAPDPAKRVYDPRIHLDEVVMPVLKKWRIFEREYFTRMAVWMRDDLGLLVKGARGSLRKFEDSKQR